MSDADLPHIKSRVLIHALGKERWASSFLRKSKGSHWQFEHSDGRRTTVPVHKGKDIGGDEQSPIQSFDKRGSECV